MLINVGMAVTSRQVNVFLISILVELLMGLLTWDWSVKSPSIRTPIYVSTSIDGTV